MKKDILGIKIDDLNINEAVERVQGWLSKGGKYYIVTPNPEIIMAAQADDGYKRILSDADLSIPDGIGLKLFEGVKNRVAGADLVDQLIRLSSDKGYRIGFLGGREGIAEKTKECLMRQYQTISVEFAESGGRFDSEGNSLSEKKLVIPPLDILFVGLGQGKQEKWIAKNKNLFSVKVFMVVGGTLDYLSGSIPRAPKLIRNLGLEWLFRLILEPWRIKRQLSLIEYIWLLTKERISR